jgi:hypothetical protein
VGIVIYKALWRNAVWQELDAEMLGTVKSAGALEYSIANLQLVLLHVKILRLNLKCYAVKS